MRAAPWWQPCWRGWTQTCCSEISERIVLSSHRPTRPDATRRSSRVASCRVKWCESQALLFLPRDATYLLSSCVRSSVRPSVRPSVRLSDYYEPVLYRNDWTNRAGLGHGGFLPPVPHCELRIFGYLQKLGYFSVELCPKLRTWKNSPRQIDRIANKTRKQSSLLMTPIRQSTSHGCFLRVVQL